jgi:hypothetical protein
LSQRIPTQIGTLGKLRYWLAMQSNFLTGPVPTEIGLLSALQFHIRLEGNSLHSLPSELGQLRSFSRYFDFSSQS